jgi:hypothetical protein
MGDTFIGGLTGLTPEDAASGSRAFWTGYVGVDGSQDPEAGRRESQRHPHRPR